MYDVEQLKKDRDELKALKLGERLTSIEVTLQYIKAMLQKNEDKCKK